MKDRRGFTLLELLIAVAILLMVISGLLVSFIYCMLLNESNNNLVIAANDAQYVLEEIKGLPFSSIGAFTPTQMNNLRNENISLNPSPSHPGGDSRVYEVTVNVSWTERTRNRNFSLSTRRGQ